MKYPELIEPCKSAIAEGRCTGCQALEEPSFKGNKDCKNYEKCRRRVMEEIKVGEYVRTKDGKIGKIYNYSCGTYKTRLFGASSGEIAKHSSDLLDLIEKGDYVNGNKVVDKNDNLRELVVREDIELVYINKGNNINKIKSIVTHEQFAQIEYKVGG